MTDLTHRTHSSCRSTSVMLENPFLLWTCTASIRADSPLAARNSSIQCWSTLRSRASNPLKLRPRRNREMQSSGSAPDRVESHAFSLLPSTAFLAELQEDPDSLPCIILIDPEPNCRIIRPSKQVINARYALSHAYPRSGCIGLSALELVNNHNINTSV